MNKYENDGMEWDEKEWNSCLPVLAYENVCVGYTNMFKMLLVCNVVNDVM